MSFVVEKVKQMTCEQCGQPVDHASVQPLMHIVCPSCGHEQRVPAQFDNYLVYELLGKGNFGFVFRAKDKGLGRDFAIKIFSARGQEADVVAETALQEARALAKLNHHNVVRVHTLGEYHDSRYIVMELLDGGSARNFTEPGNQPSELDAIVLGMCIAKGLRMAQRVGLVHMDVKPGNMLYDREGHPKLIDFGMSAHAKPGGDLGVVGTPYYIAPETALGREPDFRADMYSLGASLFHIITGRPPFDAEDTRTTIGLRLKHDAPLVSAFREGLHDKTIALIARMLRREPDERYASYDELIEAFQEAKLQVEFGEEPDDTTPAAPAVDVAAPPVDAAAPVAPVAPAPTARPSHVHAPHAASIDRAAVQAEAAGASAVVWLAAAVLLLAMGIVGWVVFGGSTIEPAPQRPPVVPRRSNTTASPSDPAPVEPSTNTNAASNTTEPNATPPDAPPAPADVSPDADLDNIPGLIAHWKLDGESGGSVADVLGHAKPGLFLGEADWLKPGRVGAAAARFDGSSYIAIDDAMPRDAYTKSAWVQRYHGDLMHPVFCGATGHALMISYLNSFRPSAGHNGHWDLVVGPTPVPPFRWQHLAVTYDPAVADGTLTLYVNGDPVGSATGVPRPNPETEMFIGTLGRASRFKGLIDDVRLYDRALTPDEIRRLAGNAITAPAPVITTTPDAPTQ
ncbi:MAG: protein kinase [Phycisphaera sp.]|nr:protein kinase [Phycisphaera sp.]